MYTYFQFPVYTTFYVVEIFEITNVSCVYFLDYYFDYYSMKMCYRTIACVRLTVWKGLLQPLQNW